MYFDTGLLRLQQIYQNISPVKEQFHVDMVKRIASVNETIEFFHKIETNNRWGNKYIVLDCSAEMAKKIIIEHAKDVKLGKRTYHYLLSGLVSKYK